MTHAEQEQQLLDYLKAYRDTINLAKWAEAAKVGVTTIKLFYGEQRGLSPEVLAKCQAYLKKQAQALQVFNA